MALGGAGRKTALIFPMLDFVPRMWAASDDSLTWSAGAAAKLSSLPQQEIQALEAQSAYDHPIPVIIEIKGRALAQHRREAVSRGLQLVNAMPLIAACNARLTPRRSDVTDNILNHDYGGDL